MSNPFTSPSSSTTDMDLTVHYLACKRDEIPHELLENASKLVIYTTEDVRWHNPRPLDLSVFNIGTNIYLWNLPPPDGLLVEEPQLTQTRKWDASATIDPSEDDSWSLEQLDQFLHGAFSVSDTESDVDSVHHSVKRPLSPERPSVAPPSTKRARFVQSSLRYVIPMPHFLHSQQHFADEYLSYFSDVPLPCYPYSPIPPHTLEGCIESIASPYSRVGWIVPVRGQLPWDDATNANILDDTMEEPKSLSLTPQDPSEVLPVPVQPHNSNTVLWTRAALVAFWSFLRSLSDAGNFGPISLSFHTASAASSTNSTVEYSCFGSHKVQTASSASAPAPENRSTLLANTRVAFLAIDHFKMYHNRQYSQSIRTALHSWSYRGRNGDQKIRVLKGAKLVLVDENSKGVLLG
ncbi:uncharacterized protein BXZ73DRAFT_48285 [Epithele typhae]|uniref:uncharacterized protein n=1 Tax=Epithele typhae TaxID=378194 RepID=UPI002008B6FD|nr:uncharacterized protein BXZ73DRAFT_48285 [Epithele typhae]KAH9929042.1 hypothetical protein BXZ73DRAFT_48285 [Epithele typhae]